MNESSTELTNLLASQCQYQGGLSFQSFMEAALYTPQLGYYQNHRIKFGPEGDFITAPYISPLFGQCIAEFCYKHQKSLPQDAILLELGAGDGRLAEDILNALNKKNALPIEYWILEPSAFLQHEQKAHLKSALPEYFSQIKWLDSLPNTFNGIIIANEVLDALPVSQFRLNPHHGRIEELFIYYDSTKGWFNHYDTPRTPHLIEVVTQSLSQLDAPLPYGYISEINLILPSFIKSFAEKLNQGMMLFIDYGFPRKEYYHPQRTLGTLMCHYRHKSHSNPLIHIGEQDITAHVDFTHLAEAAQLAQLDVLGYLNQAHFLIENGLSDLLEPNLDYYTQIKQSQAIQTLTLPHEMGELFKVMILGKDFNKEMGYQNDQRFRL